MASTDKTLARMRNHGPDGRKVTVPAHKPIKPVYVRQFVALIDNLGTERNA